MGAYILRRLMLIVPTLIGIMALNFLIIQFTPGGPIEQILAEVEEGAGSATERFSGGGDAGGGGQGGDAGGGYRGGAEVLGPAGLYASQRFGEALLPLLATILVLWIVVPLTISWWITRRRGVLA